jgi:tripartite-type tricarboxylate transporter receptor subunit TctC
MRNRWWHLQKSTTPLLAAVFMALAPAANAAYPEKPIRFVVPSAAGGSVDVLTRILAQQMSAQMGVPFVVENKPGAAFVPGTMDIVKAAPDGHTLSTNGNPKVHE